MKKTKKKSRSEGRVPVVSDKESPARQKRNEERKKGFASEKSATAKYENEDFGQRTVEELEAFLRMEDRFVHDGEGNARRLIANILSNAVSVIRDRSSAVNTMESIKSLIEWDERTTAHSLERYKRAKKAYRAKTGNKWTAK